MRRIILGLLLFFCSISVWAQKLEVTSCGIDHADKTAITSPMENPFQPGHFCALLRVELEFTGAEFENFDIVGDPTRIKDEYLVYMNDGSKKISVYVPEFLPLEISFRDYGIDHLEGQKTYRLVLGQKITVAENPVTDLSFYIGANYQIGSLTGVGASLGTYIKGVNAQLDILMGMTESEPIFWNGLSTDPYSYTYKPLYLGLKLGYGIKAGEQFRFTPQVGVGISKISGTVSHKGQGSDPEVTAMSAVPLSMGLRAEWMVVKHFGICLAPEYSIAVQKGKPYEAVSAVSSTVKGFGEGFNLKAGLFICF